MEENMSPEEQALRNIDNNKKEPSKQEQKGLDDLENASNVKSIGTVERVDYSKKEVEQTNLKHGYFSLDVKDFPTKGIFYPSDFKVRIKAATVKDIRTFSALDEDNPYEVDEALVDLLSNCVRVVSESSNKMGSWKDILEEDRLYVILAIKELTFAEDENTIAFPVKCESCGTENKMEIVNRNFQKRELNEKIAKYYSSEHKRFNVVTKSFGTINIKPPTIGIMRVVNKYIKHLKDNKENLKDYLPFLKIVPYMVEEWRGLTIESMTNYRMEFMRWDSKKFLAFSQISELAQVSVKEEMLTYCTKCNDPIYANIQLPTGIKGLFIEQNLLDDELM